MVVTPHYYSYGEHTARLFKDLFVLPLIIFVYVAFLLIAAALFILFGFSEKWGNGWRESEDAISVQLLLYYQRKTPLS